MGEPYRELFVCWASDRADDDWPWGDNHPVDVACDWGWICNQAGCVTRVDDAPCLEHGPSTACNGNPGLRLVRCAARPRHWLWAVDRADYGHGCPVCWAEKSRGDLEQVKAIAARYAHRWCWLTRPVRRAALKVGLASSRSSRRCRDGGLHVDVWWFDLRRWRR